MAHVRALDRVCRPRAGNPQRMDPRLPDSPDTRLGRHPIAIWRDGLGLSLKARLTNGFKRQGREGVSVCSAKPLHPLKRLCALTP